MRVNTSQSFVLTIYAVIFINLICVSTGAIASQDGGQPVDHAAELVGANQLLDEIEPWIRSTDFEGFVLRLELSEETQKVVNQRWIQFDKQCDLLKQDAAEKIWKTFMSKKVEANRDFVGKFGLEGAQRISRNFAKSRKQIIQNFKLHRGEFLEDLRVQLKIENATWSSAVMWLRRQRLLRGHPGHSWMDLNSLPDLHDQFERFILEDEEFLPLVEPESKIAKETAKAVQDILEDWALQTDATVDTYLINKVRRSLELRLARYTPDKKDWWSAVRMYKVKDQRRYRNFWSTSEQIASVIEPVVGPWAAGRWRLATELVIFPESFKQNSFDRLYSSVIDKGTLSDEEKKTVLQLLLPLEKKIERLHASMREATVWFESYFDIKYAGYVVPALAINLHEIDIKYHETIDAMIDVIADATPSNDWDAMREEIKQSREKSWSDRYMPRSREVAVIYFGDEFE